MRPVTEHERGRGKRSGYSAYLDRLPHQATAEDFEKWAREHPEDSSAAAALVDAGWEWSVDGEYTRALALFSEALELGRGSGGPARIGMADQLCKLGRREDAHQVLAELRAELEASAEPDGEMYAEAAGLLEECGEFAAAVEWCEAGLARCDELGRTAVEVPASGLSLRDRLLISRRAARREQGLPPDAWDEEAVVAEERGMAAFRALPRESSPAQPVFGGRVEEVVLYWPPEEFRVAAERWPVSPGSDTAGAADGGEEAARTPGRDHELHRRRVQREAERLRASGAQEVVLVSGGVQEYAEFAARTGRDARQERTLAAYAVWRHREHPELSVRWPPPRNGPCWCGSGRAYKSCCGVGAAD